MTVERWLEVTSRTWKRANMYRGHMHDLAVVAARQGLNREAQCLMSIGNRALVVADKWLTILQEEVE